MQVNELQAQLEALDCTNRNAAAELREQARQLAARDDELRRLRASEADATARRCEEAAERARLETMVRVRPPRWPQTCLATRMLPGVTGRDGGRQVAKLQEQVRELEAAAFASYTVPVRLAFPATPASAFPSPLPLRAGSSSLPPAPSPRFSQDRRPAAGLSVLAAAQATVAVARWSVEGAACGTPPPHLGHGSCTDQGPDEAAGRPADAGAAEAWRGPQVHDRSPHVPRPSTMPVRARAVLNRIRARAVTGMS